MNRLIRLMFASVFCLVVALLALPGCSPVVNTTDDGMMMPDSGMSDGSANQDAVANDDPGAICYPSNADPTCLTAQSCRCPINDNTFEGTLCQMSPDMMSVCRMGMTCMPGQNHCSIHFPPGIFAGPFECLENANGLWSEIGGTRGRFSVELRGGIYMSGRGECSGHSCYTYGYLASQMPMQVQFTRVDFVDFVNSHDEHFPCSEMRIHEFPLGTIPSATAVTATPRIFIYAGP